jgi:hypothetical protein
MIHKLNITYNAQEALDYYNNLVNNYQHLHWDYTKDHNEPTIIDKKNSLSAMHVWGLHTIYNDPSFPYHCDLDPHDEGPTWFKNTELVFDFAKKVFDFFPSAYRSCLYVHPAGTHIGKWQPAGPPHGKVIIPILSNNESYFISHTTPIVKVNPKVGNIYLIETNVDTEIINHGLTDQAAIVFNAPVETFNFMFTTKGHI